MCHFDCLSARRFTLVIFTVTDHNKSAASRTVILFFGELFFARPVNRVKQRRSTAVMQAAYPGLEQMHVVGEVLRDLVVSTETHYERFVEIRTQNMLQKTHCGLLFKIKSAVH